MQPFPGQACLLLGSVTGVPLSIWFLVTSCLGSMEYEGWYLQMSQPRMSLELRLCWNDTRQGLRGLRGLTPPRLGNQWLITSVGIFCMSPNHFSPLGRNTGQKLMPGLALSRHLSSLGSSCQLMGTMPAQRSRRNLIFLTRSAQTWRRPGFSAG